MFHEGHIMNAAGRRFRILSSETLGAHVVLLNSPGPRSCYRWHEFKGKQCSKLTILSIRYCLVLRQAIKFIERRDEMNHFEMSNFLDRIDAIQLKFLESLVTGQRDPLFIQRKPKAPPLAKSSSDIKS